MWWLVLLLSAFQLLSGNLLINSDVVDDSAPCLVDSGDPLWEVSGFPMDEKLLYWLIG